MVSEKTRRPEDDPDGTRGDEPLESSGHGDAAESASAEKQPRGSAVGRVRRSGKSTGRALFVKSFRTHRWRDRRILANPPTRANSQLHFSTVPGQGTEGWSVGCAVSSSLADVP
jgi:hypothetical protein